MIIIPIDWRKIMSFEIETGIPVPEMPKARKKKREAKYPFKDMKVGDSFYIKNNGSKKETLKVQSALSAAMTSYHKKHPRKRLTYRTVENGTRCWRIK